MGSQRFRVIKAFGGFIARYQPSFVMDKITTFQEMQCVNGIHAATERFSVEFSKKCTRSRTDLEDENAALRDSPQKYL